MTGQAGLIDGGLVIADLKRWHTGMSRSTIGDDAESVRA